MLPCDVREMYTLGSRTVAIPNKECDMYAIFLSRKNCVFYFFNGYEFAAIFLIIWMVLLSLAITTKSGQVLVARQFVEMAPSRIESLISAFPKLISHGTSVSSPSLPVSSQHTFIEVSDVRYVYQSFNNRVFLVMLTTVDSNMIEDLETLQLVSKIISDSCKPVVNEKEVTENAFNLLFAFDEIVALGYRENVNSQQLKTILEMDSHDEKVFLAMRDSQVRDVKAKMKEKARELDALRKKSAKTASAAVSSGAKAASLFSPSSSSDVKFISSDNVPTILQSSGGSAESMPHPGPRRGAGLKLGSARNKNAISQRVAHKTSPRNNQKTEVIVEETANDNESNFVSVQSRKPVHLRLEEKISATYSRNIGLQSLEVSGTLYCLITKPDYTQIRILLDTSSQDAKQKPLQIHPHPHIDKKLFQTSNVVGLRDSEKSFPINQAVFLLKWHLASDNMLDFPLNIVVWPTKTANGMDMSIEYHLSESCNITLTDVKISIPIPLGSTASVSQLDGNYEMLHGAGNLLVWSLPIIDESSDQGLIEFNVDDVSNEDEFFPIDIAFTSRNLLCGVKVDRVFMDSRDKEDEEYEDVPFDSESTLTTAKFVIA